MNRKELGEALDTELTTIIRKNIEGIQTRMEKAAQLSGRSSEDIKLVIVTKRKSAEVIRCAAMAGAKFFGENYPEEAGPKIEELGDLPVEWHMIGHLQSRKARLVARHFTVYQSIDSIRIAQKVDQELTSLSRKMPGFIEVNVSGEEEKSGFSAWSPELWGGLAEELHLLKDLKNIEIRGLMTMPPFQADPESSRPYFQRLAALQTYLSHQLPELKWKELSMGTSQDFEVAIQEGATIVRVGQAALGPRD